MSSYTEKISIALHARDDAPTVVGPAFPRATSTRDDRDSVARLGMRAFIEGDHLMREYYAREFVALDAAAALEQRLAHYGSAWWAGAEPEPLEAPAVV